jgi:hypothetical protein
MTFKILRMSTDYGIDPVVPGAYKKGEDWLIDIESIEQLLSLMNVKYLAGPYAWEPPYNIIIGRDYKNTDQLVIHIRDHYYE